MKGNGAIKVFPNPTNTSISVRYASENAKFATLKIIYATGVERLTIEDKNLKIGEREQKIDVSHLPNGTYFLKVGEQIVSFLKL